MAVSTLQPPQVPPHWSGYDKALAHHPQEMEDREATSPGQHLLAAMEAVALDRVVLAHQDRRPALHLGLRDHIHHQVSDRGVKAHRRALVQTTNHHHSTPLGHHLVAAVVVEEEVETMTQEASSCKAVAAYRLSS